MKKNYKNISLLLMSIMLTLSANSAFAVNQDPESITDSQTVNTSVDNDSLTNYNAVTTDGSVNVGGGIYNVSDTGSLTVGTSSSVIFDNIAAMITPPDTGGNSMGRMGGIIYNAGDLYIGATSDGSNVTPTGEQVTFSNNVAGQGGAINNTGVAHIYNAIFENNTANVYGNDPSYSSTGSGWDTANSGRGGAIFNVYNSANPETTGELTIIGSKFNNNYAGNYGGALYNGNGGNVVINGQSSFTGNHAYNEGGAIYNSITNSSDRSATIEIREVSFDGNYTTNGSGGAIANISSNENGQSSIITINGANFTNNAANSSGGAIYNNCSNNTTMTAQVNISGTTFNNNGILQRDSENATVTSSGGAVYNTGHLKIDGNSSFTNNTAVSSGGAVTNAGVANISNTTFANNGNYSYRNNSQDYSGVTNMGGAIYNSSTSAVSTDSQTSLTVNNVTFTNNIANNGGAIYNNDNATIIDSTFNGNQANNQGGAIYGTAGSNTTVLAQNRDVNFVTDTDTIYLNAGTASGTTTPGAILNLNANSGRNVNLNGAVSGASTSDSSLVPVVNVNYDDAGYTGNVNFNAGASNVNLIVHNGVANANARVANSTVETRGGTMRFTDDRYLGTVESKADGHLLNDVVLNGGTLDIQNGVVSNIALDSLTLSSTTNLKVDVDVVNEQMDNLLQENIGDGSGSGISINNGNINISDMNLVNEGEKDSANILFTNVDGLTVDNVTTDVNTLEGKIYRYSVDKVSGSQLGLAGDAADDVYFSFQNTGGPSDNVTPTPVAQIGAFLLMDNIYRQSFANMDMISILTRDERENLKNYNRYANMFEDEINTFYQDKRQEDYPSVFVRAFTNFEKVPLKRGPHVDSIFYGTLIGHESGLYELGKGWDANYAVFGAYTGAYQHYNGINMYQNGGAAGGVFTAYKGDFWTGITANAGGWAVEAHNDFGSEHFPMLGTGVAAKAGYNWRLFNNKFIIQPSYMMSYTFIYAYSHNNAAGVHIKQDPLHAIEIIPGVKLIANNFKNGWQPYLAVNMTWVCMDGARFWANDVAFNRLSIRPFVEYGIGIQKHHGEHATGYLQAMVRNGGRNGVALTGGFRWAIGEDIID